MKYYIFRVDRNNFVFKELSEGRLRQGWGVKNMSFLNENGEILSQDEWINNYFWIEESKERKISKYNNLKNMLNMEKGDIIIIPRAPHWDSFTIACVKKRYQFSLIEEDFGHLIEIFSDSLKEYKYGANEITKQIASRFKAYQSPINNIYNSFLIEEVKKLLSESIDLERENIDEELEEVEEFSIESYCSSLKELEKKELELTVPIYQRPYSWNEDHINRFLTSILESFGSIEIGKKRKNMFIGTIQLGSNDYGGFDIIDGQQRLTTLNLLTFYLKDKSDRSRPYFKTDVGGQQESFESIFYGDKNEKKEEKSNGENIYERNFWIIAKYIESIDSIELVMKEFIDHIENNLKFVIVETKATLTETLNIFDTINTSGMDLNGADVFKIKMYEYMKKFKNAEKTIFIEIDNLYKKVLEENKKYKINIKMSEILDLYKDYLIATYNLPIGVMKMGTNLFFEKVFDGLIRNKFDSQILSEDNIKKIELSLEKIDELIEARFKWEKLYEEFSVQTRFNENLIYWSRYGKYFKAIHYMQLRKEEKELDDISRLIEKLSKLFIVYSVVYDKQVNAIMRFMKEIYSKILTGESLKQICEDITKTIKDHPDGWDISSNFKNKINEPLATKTTSKNLLCRLDAKFYEHLNKEEIIKRFFEEKIDIEHIQSYNDSENAEKVREEWQDELNSIGNLMILESSINRSIGNSRFSDKKEKYNKSSYEIVKDVARLNHWNKEKALKRREESTKKIFDFIYEN
ncbi:MAG: DUF262 domain-containing protein [Clostridium sp.]